MVKRFNKFKIIQYLENYLYSDTGFRNKNELLELQHTKQF